MNNLQIFKNEKFGEVRTVTIKSEPWFVGKDVTKALKYSNSRKALADHVQEDDKGVTKCDTLGGKQDLTIINESGLYSLIFGSRLESAKEFKHWVTSEVLPAIRKHGAYAVDELLNDPDMAIKAFTALKEEREKNKFLTVENERMKPKEIFADAVASSQTYILVGELAKILNQNGVNIGQNRLFEWLRNKGYLIKRKGSDWNMPTQKAIDQGLFYIKESTIVHSDGHVTVNKTPKVTGKGQQYFINLFLKNKELLK